MSLSILQSVGVNAVNQIADVKLIQVLLNSHIHWKALYIHVKVDGHAGDKTKEAIKRFQREMMNRKNPDGRVDPNGSTLRFLTMNLKPVQEAAIQKQVREGRMVAGAPVVSAKTITAAAGLIGQTVSYASGISKERQIVNEYTLRVIKMALKEAGLKSAVITSTIRTPEIQADAMYTNCKKKGGLAYQKEHVYKNPKSPARAVLKVFEENSTKPEAEVVKLMAEKIVELGTGPKPQRVSDHCVTKEAYAIKNVIDLRIPALQADNDKLVSVLKKLQAEGYIHYLLPEPKNSCIHIEIIVHAKELQKYEGDTILNAVVYC